MITNVVEEVFVKTITKSTDQNTQEESILFLPDSRYFFNIP